MAPGTQVTIAFDGDESDTDTFVLGSRELLGLDDAVETTNVYSPQSPLGAAILGKRIGDKASYEAPNGKSINVTIVDVAFRLTPSHCQVPMILSDSHVLPAETGSRVKRLQGQVSFRAAVGPRQG